MMTPTDALVEFVQQRMATTAMMQTSPGLQLNLIKSGILVSHDAVKLAMNNQSFYVEVTVKEGIKDLGVVQGAGNQLPPPWQG